MNSKTIRKLSKTLLSSYTGKRVYYGLSWFFGQFVNDEVYLRILYRLRTGKKLNLKKPVRFNEKINWLKVNYRTPLHTLVADKYEVRSYVEKKVGSEFLVPLLGVYDSFDEINFSQLPNQFILKATHGSGWNMICNNKNEFDINLARKNFNLWLDTNYYYPSRNWEYKNIRPRIICEKLLVPKNNQSLNDYKIHCFDGLAKYIQVVLNRDNSNEIKQAFFDPKWKRQSFNRELYSKADRDVKRPNHLREMIDVAQKLSVAFTYSRIDLYNCNGKIYFGEITLSPSSGMGKFKPDKYDYELGEMILLNDFI